MNKIGIMAYILIGFFGMAVNVDASDVDDLLDFLTEKGAINAGDEVSFKENLAKKKQEEADGNKGFELTASRLLRLSGYAQVRYRLPEIPQQALTYTVQDLFLTET